MSAFFNKNGRFSFTTVRGYAILFVFAVVFLLPFYWMFATALKGIVSSFDSIAEKLNQCNLDAEIDNSPALRVCI